MKKTVSAILVCLLLVGTLLTLGSCSKAVMGEYEAEVLGVDRTYKFGLFGKVTLIIDSPLSDDDDIYEGKYELNEDGDKITLTFEDETANKIYGGESNFEQGTKNGDKYIKIGLVEYEKAD